MVCVPVEDPHVVQRDELPCQQYERAIEINGLRVRRLSLLTYEGQNVTTFAPMTNFTPFPLRKETDPALPGGALSSLYSVIL